MASLAYIQVTRRCNQNCRFCSNPPNKRELSLEEGKKLIDMYLKQGFDGLIFTGGEPTLSPILPDLIKYAKEKKFPYRIITNGQKLSDINYLKSLKEAGLYHLHLSIYSVREEVQNFLTRTPGSFKNIIKSLENLGKVGGITVDINTVINHYNADHLFENVKFLVEKFPFIHHFVWNNLDPATTRARRNKDTIPKLNEFELSLHQAMEYLEEKGKTFRTERIPLCYLAGYEWTLNETRKIVKAQKRYTYFLDDRGFLKENDWLNKWGYKKSEACKHCSLNAICPGLYKMGKYYSAKELYPVFVDKEQIIRKIKETSEVEREKIL